MSPEKPRCELSYNKIYLNATKRSKLSNVKRNYDPVAFGKWLTDAYNSSRYKSWQEVADALGKIRGATRSTLSRYAGAKPQLLTSQPSQPNVEFVAALANLFGKDVRQALNVAGHAAPIDASDFDDKVRVAFQGADKFSDQEKVRVLEAVKVFVAGIRAEQKARGKE